VLLREFVIRMREDVALDLMIVKNFVRLFTTKIGDICIGFKIAQRPKD